MTSTSWRKKMIQLNRIQMSKRIPSKSFKFFQFSLIDLIIIIIIIIINIINNII